MKTSIGFEQLITGSGLPDKKRGNSKFGYALNIPSFKQEGRAENWRYCSVRVIVRPTEYATTMAAE